MFQNYLKDAFLINYAITITNIFSKYHCGFGKGFSTEHAILVMIKKMKNALENNECCAVNLTYLSKAFHCIYHDLLIAKLNAYGFDRNALNFIYDFFSDRLQKSNVSSSVSAYLDIIYGVPQGSILEPLLFNIDLRDLLFEDYSSDFANDANNATSYESAPTLNEVMNNLEITPEKMFKWFSFNNLKVNALKYNLFLSPYQPVPANIKESTIESNNCEKLLEIYIASNFSVEYHIKRICRKASQSFHDLTRIGKYIYEDKKRMLFKSFIISQFNYCPIVWMCHGRGLNNKINNIHERALRIV